MNTSVDKSRFITLKNRHAWIANFSFSLVTINKSHKHSHFYKQNINAITRRENIRRGILISFVILCVFLWFSLEFTFVWCWKWSKTTFFLLACTLPYNLVCQFIGLSICPSVRPSIMLVAPDCWPVGLIWSVRVVFVVKTSTIVIYLYSTAVHWFNHLLTDWAITHTLRSIIHSFFHLLTHTCIQQALTCS